MTHGPEEGSAGPSATASVVWRIQNGQERPTISLGLHCLASKCADLCEKKQLSWAFGGGWLALLRGRVCPHEAGPKGAEVRHQSDDKSRRPPVAHAHAARQHPMAEGLSHARTMTHNAGHVPNAHRRLRVALQCARASAALHTLTHRTVAPPPGLLIGGCWGWPPPTRRGPNGGTPSCPPSILDAPTNGSSCRGAR